MGLQGKCRTDIYYRYTLRKIENASSKSVRQIPTYSTVNPLRLPSRLRDFAVEYRFALRGTAIHLRGAQFLLPKREDAREGRRGKILLEERAMYICSNQFNYG